jgi:hypothetical protein
LGQLGAAEIPNEGLPSGGWFVSFPGEPVIRENLFTEDSPEKFYEVHPDREVMRLTFSGSVVRVPVRLHLRALGGPRVGLSGWQGEVRPRDFFFDPADVDRLWPNDTHKLAIEG